MDQKWSHCDQTSSVWASRMGQIWLDLTSRLRLSCRLGCEHWSEDDQVRNDQRGTCADGALGIARKPLGREKSPPPCLPSLSSIDSLWLWLPKVFLLSSSFLTWDIGPLSSASPPPFPPPTPPPPSLVKPAMFAPLLLSPENPPNPETPPKFPRFGPSSSTSSLMAKQSGWSGSLKQR